MTDDLHDLLKISLHSPTGHGEFWADEDWDPPMTRRLRVTMALLMAVSCAASAYAIVSAVRLVRNALVPLF